MPSNSVDLVITQGVPENKPLRSVSDGRLVCWDRLRLKLVMCEAVLAIGSLALSLVDRT